MRGPAGGCLELEAVQAFVAGALDPEAVEGVEEHLDDCADCRALVAELARGSASGALAAAATPASAFAATAAVSGTGPTEIGSTASGHSAVHPAPGTRIGRYVIERPLGAGGMGAVSLADDPELKRKVCLKLLRPELLDPGNSQATRARLLREAQAMAQVSHPNVVAVFDIGTHEDQVFIAMEYIEGCDLAKWLALAQRSAGEALDIFRAAGRGLAAAHRAGLIHRDFKPQNVMIGADGSVKVTDFGLVRAEPETAPGGAGAPPREDALLGSVLTATGALVGTPAYMAPEQVRGEALDARCDQFAFAVALYEALFGQRPFAGTTLGEIHAAAMAGRMRAMPRRRGVSRRVRAAIARGLRASPTQRFATLDSLLAELAPRTTRRVAIAAAAILLVAGGAAATGLTGGDESTMCDGGAALMAAVWGGGPRDRIRAGFAATGLKAASSSSSALTRELDLYAGEWIRAHREACAATRVREEQTEDIMALRMACLERRRAELAATVGLLEHPDAELVNGAFDLPSNLSAIADCADTKSLSAPLPLPRDAKKREQIAAARAQVARTEALLHAQRLDQARTSAGQAQDAATRIGWGPLLAEARLSGARIDLHLVRLDDADKGFDAAAVAAEQAGHDEVRIEAYFGLMQVSKQRGQLDQALRWAGYARAAIERTGSRVDKLATLSAMLGQVYGYKGDARNAIAELQRTIELDARAFGAKSSEVANAHYQLGAFYHQLRDYDQAYSEFEKALAMFTEVETGGADHPNALFTVKTMASMRDDQGRHEEALVLAERAVAGLQRLYGDDHANTAAAFYVLGQAQGGVGRVEEALASEERAIAIWRRVLGPRSKSVAALVGGVALTLSKVERWKEAGEHMEEAIEMTLADGGVEKSREIIQYRAFLASMYMRQKRYDAAIDQLTPAIASAEAILAPDAQELADTLTTLGSVYNRKGEPARALPPLERALRMRQTAKAGGGDSSWTKLEVAKALWDTRRDRPRALRLASESLAEATKVQHQVGIEVAEKWLATHRAPRRGTARTR